MNLTYNWKDIISEVSSFHFISDINRDTWINLVNNCGVPNETST